MRLPSGRRAIQTALSPVASRFAATCPLRNLTHSGVSPSPLPFSHAQGRVRTKTVKRSARQIVEKYYGKLTLDFDTNKRVTDEVALVPSKRMRNKIAGFVTVRRSP